MLYPEKETDVSYRFFYALADGLPASTCLIGGHAEYYTVRAACRRDLGADYLGSRDIDLGLRDRVCTYSNVLVVSPITFHKG